MTDFILHPPAEMIVVPGVLCRSEAEALAQPGTVVRHIKKGGIYRKLGEAKYSGEGVKYGVPLEGTMMATFEHLWPCAHGYFCRPVSEFTDIVDDGDGKGLHPRFEPI